MNNTAYHECMKNNIKSPSELHLQNSSVHEAPSTDEQKASRRSVSPNNIAYFDTQDIQQQINNQHELHLQSASDHDAPSIDFQKKMKERNTPKAKDNQFPLDSILPKKIQIVIVF